MQLFLLSARFALYLSQQSYLLSAQTKNETEEKGLGRAVIHGEKAGTLYVRYGLKGCTNLGTV